MDGSPRRKRLGRIDRPCLAGTAERRRFGRDVLKVGVDREGASLLGAFGGTREEHPVARRRPSVAAERPPSAGERHAPCIAPSMAVTELTGKVVVVTGGTAGVGYAACEAFAGAGARTAVLSRDSERVQQTVETLRAAGHDAHGWAVDVSDAAALDRVAAEIEARVGPIDVWVNNAMTTVFGRFADMTVEEFDKATANTYLGTVNGTRVALTRMLGRGHGTIVQVGSALAHQSIPLQSAYCGAKHAVRGFTNALRCELIKERSGVRLTMVQLAAFNTPQFDWARSYLDKNPRPVAPVFAPDLAARAIVRAAVEPRREYWVGWPAMKTILGARLLPGLAERMAAKQAYDGQFSSEPAAPRAGNLFEPVSRAAGAPGRFVDETKPSSVQWWISANRFPVGAGALGAAIAVALLWAALT